MKGLADALRKRKEVAQLAILSGDPTSQTFGGSLHADVSDQFATRAKEMESQKQRDLTKGYYDQMAEQQGLSRALQYEELEEMKRHHMATEKNMLAKSMQKQRRAPPVAAQKKTMAVISGVDDLNRLADMFQDDYASSTGFGEGTASNLLTKYTPFGTQGMRDQQNWWALYDQIYTLPTRNDMFGSALTAPERASWASANIGPDSSVEVIKQGIARLQGIANNALKKQFANDAPLFDEEWVYSVYGDHADNLGFGQGEDPSAPTAPEGGVAPSSGLIPWDEVPR